MDSCLSCHMNNCICKEKGMEETFQYFYERFTLEDIDPNELSANAFGLIVWNHQQKKIDEVTAERDSIEYKMTVYEESNCELRTKLEAIDLELFNALGELDTQDKKLKITVGALGDCYCSWGKVSPDTCGNCEALEKIKKME